MNKKNIIFKIFLICLFLFIMLSKIQSNNNEKEIKQLVDENKLILSNITFKGVDITMELKVYNMSFLSNLIKALDNHSMFIEPKLIRGDEFHMPHIVLLTVKIKT